MDPRVPSYPRSPVSCHGISCLSILHLLFASSFFSPIFFYRPRLYQCHRICLLFADRVCADDYFGFLLCDARGRLESCELSIYLFIHPSPGLARLRVGLQLPSQSCPFFQPSSGWILFSSTHCIQQMEWSIPSTLTSFLFLTLLTF